MYFPPNHYTVFHTSAAAAGVSQHYHIADAAVEAAAAWDHILPLLPLVVEQLASNITILPLLLPKMLLSGNTILPLLLLRLLLSWITKLPLLLLLSLIHI